MLGPKAKKEIFGHHRMWKKSLSQEPQCLLVCSQYAPPRPPPQHTYIPPITGKLGGPSLLQPCPLPNPIPFLHSKVAAALRALQTGGFS